MPYQGVDGLHTVFPTGKIPAGAYSDGPRQPKTKRAKAPKAKKAKKASLASLRSAFSAATKPIKAPKKKGIRVPARAQTAAAGAVYTGAVALATNPGYRAVLGQLAAAVRAYKGPLAARIMGPLAAGLVSYAITTAILNRIKENRDNRQQAANILADQYRQLRKDAAAAAGRPLSRTELDALAKAFKSAAAAQGLTDLLWKGA